MINVIGGSGFIGTAVCDILSKKNIIFSIVDKAEPTNFKNVFKSSEFISLLRKVISDGDILINLAAEHKDDVSPISLYYETNVEGAENICQVAREKNIKKIIFTSSVAVYGFAKLDTDESGVIAPFNHYGISKWEAEKIYKKWQSEDSENRTLIIIRPTVVFGERNRGNVYGLLKQISSGKFAMIGSGRNRKSMAYVYNLVSFLIFSMDHFDEGIHIYNYVDKPDLTMNELVSLVKKVLHKQTKFNLRVPFFVGITIGIFFDFLSKITGKKFSISSIRVKKFCSDSVYASAIDNLCFTPPVPLINAIENTISAEFLT